MNPVDMLAAMPPALAGFIGVLAPLCIAVILWAVLPRRSSRGTGRRDADIERQIKTLRRSADHGVATRPRVLANGYQPDITPGTVKAPPRKPSQPCGGGLCRKRIDCHDVHCPGQAEARRAARSVANFH